MHEGDLSIEGADNKQSNFANALKNWTMKGLEKNTFLNNLKLLFSTRENVLNSFKSRLFPIKKLGKIPTRELAEPAAEPAAEKTPTKNKKSKSKLQQEFIKVIIANEKDIIANEIFWDYFKYQNPSFLAKDLIRATQAKNK